MHNMHMDKVASVWRGHGKRPARSRPTASMIAALSSCGFTECVLPSDRPLRIVCAGDSLTRGNQSGKVSGVKVTGQLGAAKPNLQKVGDETRLKIGCYPCELAARLPHGTDVRNIGVRGQTAHGLSEELSSGSSAFLNISGTRQEGRNIWAREPSAFAMTAHEVLPHADALVLMIGTNDAMETLRTGWDLSRYVASVHSLVRQLLKIRAGRGRVSARCVWLVIPPAIHDYDRQRRAWREDNWTGQVRHDLPRLVREAAAGLHLSVIDAQSALERDWSRAFGLQDPMRPEGDGLHLPPVGMALIADAVAHELRRSTNQTKWLECLKYTGSRQCGT